MSIQGIKQITVNNKALKPLLDLLQKEKDLLKEIEVVTDPKRKKELLQERKFVGYVLDINYSRIKVITTDAYKQAVGGIPQGSYLIVVPQTFEPFPPNLILVEVLESSTTPLSNQVQNTFFDLQKRNMPEIDIITQNELQWGALLTNVIGC